MTPSFIQHWEVYSISSIRWDTLREICIPVRSVKKHSKERITSRNTCIFMIRKNSNVASVVNATVGRVSWKPINAVTIETNKLLCGIWGVHIVWKILQEHILWSVMAKFAPENLLIQTNPIWKLWCFTWLLLKESIVKHWRRENVYQAFWTWIRTYQRSH